MSAEQALSRALEVSPTLANARARLEEARGVVSEVKSGGNPRLEMQGRYTFLTPELDLASPMGSMPMVVNNNFQASLVFEQTIATLRIGETEVWAARSLLSILEYSLCMRAESYTTSEAATRLGVSRPTLLRWFRDDRISPVGRDWRGWRSFTEADIERIQRELGQTDKATEVSVNPKMLSYLSRVPAFSRLSAAVLTKLAECARFRGFLKGSLFFSPGERCSGLHLLVKGRVHVLRLSPEGREQLLAVVVPFQTLGEAAIFCASETHSSYAICQEGSTVLTLPLAKTRSLTMLFPELALAFLNEFANRIEDLERRLEETALYPLEKRLASYLLKHANRQNQVALAVSNSALASRFGVARESVSRTLAKFEEQGMICRQGRTISLLSRSELASLS